MKKVVNLILLCCLCSIVYSQPRFNRIYRMFAVDSTGLQTATVFHSLRVLDNRIYIAGIGTRGVDSFYTNSGIFSSFDMSGNLIKNTYYGIIPTNSDFTNDVILVEPNNQFSLAGFNFDYTFSFLKVDKDGNTLFNKSYIPLDTSSKFGTPNSFVKIGGKYIFSLYAGYGPISKSIVYIIDTIGNTKRVIEIRDNERISNSKHIIKNNNNNFTICLFNTSNKESDSTYIYTSQLREMDTLGTTKWVYNTPRNRYIYFKKIIQLANGNYLAWGDEELSNIVGRFRKNYLVGPYIAEINPERGIVWEKLFNLGTSRMYGFKMLKDSSMVLACSYDDGPNNTSTCIIKLSKNRDSLYRRNFRVISIASNRVSHFPNQIEELDNGDLLIGGYVTDWSLASPTVGQWGWLVRTDSMGCSLEPSSCRTPTKEIEKYPLSINAYPNPTSGNLTIDFEIQNPFKTATFSLMDITGREVLNQKIENSQKQVVWQTEHLHNGLYFIVLKIDNQIVYQSKVSVQK